MTRVGAKGSAGLIVGVQSFQALAYGGIALFLPLIRSDLHLDYTLAGLLSLVATATYAAMQIPAGILGDRISPRLLFLLGALGTNLCSLALAALTSFSLILANQAISGIFRALIFAPGMLLMRSMFPDNRQATAVGLYVTGGVSSSVLLNLIGPLLIGPLGWRAIFVIFSAVGVSMVVLYFFVGDLGPGSARQNTVSLAAFWSLIRNPVLGLSGVLQFVRYAVVQATGYWFPTLLIVEKGFSLQSAGLLLGIGAVLGAPSNLLGGYIADRTRRPLWVIGGGMTILMLVLVMIVNVTAVWAVAIAVLLISLFVQVYFGPLFDLPMSVLDRRYSGLVSGFSNFCANVGGLVFSFLLGVLKDTWNSFSPGLYGLAALCLIGVSTSVLLGRVIRTRSSPAAAALEPAAVDQG